MSSGSHTKADIARWVFTRRVSKGGRLTITRFVDLGMPLPRCLLLSASRTQGWTSRHVSKVAIIGNDEPFSASRVGVALYCRRACENLHAGIFICDRERCALPPVQSELPP